MSQKEYNEILFHNLKKNIGNIVTCISYDNGIRKEINGTLKEVNDRNYITLGNDIHVTDIIPFIGSGTAIFAIFHEEEIIYLNNDIKDGYDITDYNEIRKLRKKKFYEEETNVNYSFNELKNLYAFFNTLHSNYYHQFISLEDADNCLCIVKESDNWAVYMNANHEKDFLHFFDNITEACLYAITLISNGMVMQKELMIEFTNNLRKEYSKEEINEFFESRNKGTKKLIKKN